MISIHTEDDTIQNIPHHPGVLQTEVLVEREVEVLDFEVVAADPLL